MDKKKIFLPEDIGDAPEKLGKKSDEESYSLITATDALISFASVLPPTNEAEELDPVFEPASENAADVFALRRLVPSETLFRNVSRYDIEPNQWDTLTADTSAVGGSSVVWTGRVNFRATYPGLGARVDFVGEESCIRGTISPFDQVDGLQQALIFSKRLFATGSASPIFITMAVSMSLASPQTCSKEWGWFSGSGGYFFRIKGDGSADNFVIVYRRVLNGQVDEVEIPRSDFNADKLDGSGASGHIQSFSNVGMFGIEVGGLGVGAKFYSYITTETLPRWVLMHHLTDDSDSSQTRTIDAKAFPLSFDVRNTSRLGAGQFIKKYGTSVTSIGSPTADVKTYILGVDKTHTTSRFYTLMMGLRIKELQQGLQNFATLLPIAISGYADIPSVVTIFKAKSISGLTWVPVQGSSTLEYKSTRNAPLANETVLASFAVSKGFTQNLEEIFSVNRNFFSSSYSNDIRPIGDSPVNFLTDVDEVWFGIRALDNTPATPGSDQVLWDEETIVNFEITYAGKQPISYPVSLSVNFSEV